MSDSKNKQRSLAFSASGEPRFWWHRLLGSDYLPPIYALLSENEWQLMRDWFAETSRENLVGECAVLLMSFLQGFVMGNIVRRIVQLGTHSGYSALLLGFYLREMGARHALFTLEIGESLCEYTRNWLGRAGLMEVVHVEHRSSVDPSSGTLACEYLGGAPELVFIDSSHEYGATREELDYWYPELAPSGLIVLHDTSEFAVSFDVTRKGGVKRALDEWRAQNPGVESFSFNRDVRSTNTPLSVGKDFCGFGLIYKPLIKPLVN
ncbi:MAG: class I SAM-dependent methyltransferase [Verrucomicrobia bacterium]|nr:MAG: class I SAM-dependent methyltransferase [Verrucomicrobiota bacterium]